MCSITLLVRLSPPQAHTRPVWLRFATSPAATRSPATTATTSSARATATASASRASGKRSNSQEAFPIRVDETLVQYSHPLRILLPVRCCHFTCHLRSRSPLEGFRFYVFTRFFVPFSANRSGRGAFSKRSPKKANGAADADAASVSSNSNGNANANGSVNGAQPNEQSAAGSKASYSFRPRESVYLEGYVRLTSILYHSVLVLLLQVLK